MKKLLIGLFGPMTQASFAQQDQLEVSEGANAGDWNLDWNGVGGAILNASILFGFGDLGIF